jgi:ABC-type transporter Mla MlaB component
MKRTQKPKRRRTARPSTPATVTLPAECLLASAAALQKSLVALLGEPQSVRLDTSAVTRIDTASLQLLAAFARDRRASERPVEWRGLTEPFNVAARLLNLEALLGLPPAGAGA